MDRIHALIAVLKHDWDELNLAAKSLVIIGGLLFTIIIYITVSGSLSLQTSKEVEVIFRSSLASVFGFILSSNTKNDNKKSLGRKSLQRRDYEEDECDEMCERIRAYDYCDGNSVQISIALIIAIVSAGVILVIYICSINTDNAILSQFRDLMCTSIGFLLGESKIKSD